MWLRGFLAGFVSTLLFHQGALWLLNQVADLGRPVWAMNAVPPLGVPAVVSLAFWGGLWGLFLGLTLRGQRGLTYWLLAIAFGAIAPTLVALLVVFPLKGLAFAAGGDLRIANPSEQSRMLLSLTSLDQVLKVSPTLKEALSDVS